MDEPKGYFGSMVGAPPGYRLVGRSLGPANPLQKGSGSMMDTGGRPMAGPMPGSIAEMKDLGPSMPSVGGFGHLRKVGGHKKHNPFALQGSGGTEGLGMNGWYGGLKSPTIKPF